MNRRDFLLAGGAMIGLAATGSADEAPPRRRVEIAAHRGESHDAPENTLASFELAWKRGDDAAELDVHLTRDGRLIVSHDPDTARLAGEKRVIKDHTAADLRQLDVGKWKGPDFAGQRLPFLEEVLATIPPGKRLFIEVKIGPEAIAPLAACLKAAQKAPEQTVVIAFNIETIREARRVLPGIKAYWLAAQKQDARSGAWTPTAAELIAKAKGAGATGLDVGYKPPVDAAFIKAVHDAGLECYAWTVDDPRIARQLVAAGIDGITTNRAAWLKGQLGD